MKPLCNSKIVAYHAIQACAKCREGAIIELGVFEGATSVAIRQHCRRDPQYAIDTFEGMPYYGSAVEAAGGFVKGYLAPSSAQVTIDALTAQGIHVMQGTAETQLPTLADVRFAFAFLDMDLEAPTRMATQFLLPRMLPGARIGFHDYLIRDGYCLSGIAKVVHEFFGTAPFKHEVTRPGHPRDNRFIFFEIP
jgi:hypothetical protein